MIPTNRLPLALNLSAAALAIAVPAWGAIGALSIATHVPADVDRFVLFLLTTWSLGALMVNLAARLLAGQQRIVARQDHIEARQRRTIIMLHRESDAGDRVVQLGDRIARRLVDTDR